MIEKIKEIIKKPSKIIRGLNRLELLKWVSDESYISWRYKSEFGEYPNLKTPKNFNEKLLWLKLNDHNPKYTELVDKFEVRKYIHERIGEKYLIPLIGVWDSVEEIDWKKLPEKFVIKCTHDSGTLTLCHDKKKLDINKVKGKLKKAMTKNYYYAGREWPYKNVKPRIIAEKFISEENSDNLKDYRFFCFNGNPKFITVDENINDKKKTKRNLYDLDWNLIDAEISYPNDEKLNISKPNRLDEMIKISKTLSKNIPFVRIDLYYIDKIDQIYFGEITLYHQSGLGKITPMKFNRMVGDWIQLPD